MFSSAKIVLLIWFILMSMTPQSMAGIMIPLENQPSQNITASEDIRLGGNIGKIDDKGAQINAIYYPFYQSGVRVHDFSGKIVKVSALKKGMLVSFKVIQHNESIKISEIWVIKDV